MKRFVILFLLGVFAIPAYSQTATIYIMREANVHSSVELPTIAINSTFIGKLSSRRYFKCTVPAGKVHIECDVADTEHIRFEIKSGEIAYFNTYTAMGKFTRLANADGEYKLRKLTLERTVPITNAAIDDTPKPAVAEAKKPEIVMSVGEFEDELIFTRMHYAQTHQKLITIYSNRDKYFLPSSTIETLKSYNNLLAEKNKSIFAMEKNINGTVDNVEELHKANEFLDLLDSLLESNHSNILIAEAKAKEPVVVPQPVAPVQQNIAAVEPKKEEKPKSDVDINIPITSNKRDNTFVLIIANENYKTEATNISSVPFAINDGEIFKEYCIKTLGIPEHNTRIIKDASKGLIEGGIAWLKKGLNLPAMDGGKMKGIVYYCGHGDHDTKTKEPYIIPTDGQTSIPSTCYSLNKLYRDLSATNAESVTYFIDACFSGTGKDGSMLLAARGIAQAPKDDIIEGNTVVFAASTGDETAIPYTEKQHGMFTYYLLKKLQESQGNISYGDLADYIITSVQRSSFISNKSQTPTVGTGLGVQDTWEQLTF